MESSLILSVSEGLALGSVCSMALSHVAGLNSAHVCLRSTKSQGGSSVYTCTCAHTQPSEQEQEMRE